jgi:hypothetical protein
MHLRHTHLFWIAIIALALILTTLLKETGTAVLGGIEARSSSPELK